MAIGRWTGALGAVAVLATPAPALAITAQQRPGTLVSSTPMAGAPAGARAWRIRYLSRTDKGASVPVTGVVIAPVGRPPRGGRPVIAWAHGTWGVVSKCSPSISPQFFGATPGLKDAIARGYTVVASDYPGLGGPGTHPFLVGDSAAHAMLDSVRAARAMPQAGAGARFAVWGESQGGHAALFTGEAARSYAPDLTLTGVAAAAPPTDLVANLTGGSDPSLRAFFTAFAAHSWSRHFDIPMATIGRPATARLIDRLAQNCVVLGKRPKLGMVIGIAALRRDLKGVDLGRIQPWARIARDNSAGRRPAGAPLLVAQAVSDPLVSPQVTRDFVRGACRRGERVRFISIPGGNHGSSAADTAVQTLDWIDGRFAGRPAPTDCGKI